MIAAGVLHFRDIVSLLRARQKLGKYRILGRIASGPLAVVYKAADTIHKTRVALKIPKSDDNVTHEDFLREVAHWILLTRHSRRLHMRTRKK